MAQPNGPQPSETTPAAVSDAQPQPMTGDEKASQAFARLVRGEDPYTIRADLQRSETRPEQPRNPEEATGARPPAQPASPTPPAQPAKVEKAAKPSDEDVVRARAVLKRDGWTDEDLEGFDATRLVRVAENRRKVQSDMDRLASSKAAQPKEKAEAQTDRDAAPQGAEDEDLSLVEEYDPELAARLRTRMKAQPAPSNQADQERLKARFRETVDKLATDYPEIRDQAQLDKVISRADRLARTGDYHGSNDPMEAVFRDAAMLELGDRRAQNAQQALLRRNQEQRDAQIEPDVPSMDGGKPVDSDKRDSYAFQLLRSGMDPQEVRRRVNQLTVV